MHSDWLSREPWLIITSQSALFQRCIAALKFVYIRSWYPPFNQAKCPACLWSRSVSAYRTDTYRGWSFASKFYFSKCDLSAKGVVGRHNKREHKANFCNISCKVFHFLSSTFAKFLRRNKSIPKCNYNNLVVQPFSKQCDQVARLFFNFWTFISMQSSSQWHTKFAKVGLRFDKF